MKKIVCSFIIVSLCFLTFGCSSKKEEIIKDSNVEGKEVYNYLVDKGYEYNAVEDTGKEKYHYINIFNEKDGLYVWKMIKNPGYTTRDIYRFQDESVNDNSCDFIFEVANDSKNDKDQLDAYNKWLKKMKLKNSQIVKALNYCESITDKYQKAAN